MYDPKRHLEPGFFVNSDHPAVRAYADQHAGRSSDSPRDRAVSLYYAIRDGFRYNPWDLEVTPEAFKASAVAVRSTERGGHCIDKATLLAACCRYCGIPSRLHFANVRNHIGTAELERLLGTDLLVFHGYAELWLGDKWVAATPAFNRELCEHLGVDPLEFDGVHDSVFQQHDRAGGKFMEYVDDHGPFDEIPYDQMVAAWKQHYPPVAEINDWPRRN
jgi:transglutaminase-like putative cysteine protease